MEKEIIDFKEWTVPEKWEDLSLQTFQDIERYYVDKENADIRDIIHILCNKTIDEVNQLPSDFLSIIMSKLSFMSEPPEVKEPSLQIEIDGEKYRVNIKEKLRTGEYIAVEMAMKADKHDLASILAILCRKDGELYDAEFEAEKLQQRREMFLKQPATKVLPIVNFFIQAYMTLEAPSQLCMVLEGELNHIQKNIKTSRNIGIGRKFFMNWRVKRLQKLLRSIKSH